MHKPSPRLATALEFLLYAALTALMLHATWLTWPDAFIDFSRELYLPWRVSCGDVLYRDIPYFFGPLSVYANAALFALLGRPSIHALFTFNFAFWVATLLALRALLRRIASPLAATAAVSAFILLFSFNRYLPTGNYNFLAPYTHELPRGFLLALLSLLTLDSALAPSPRGLSATGRVGEPPPGPQPSLSPLLAPSPRGLPAAGRVGETLHSLPFLLPGFLFGLVAFTKPEVFLAASAAVAVRFFFALSGHRAALRSVMLPAVTFPSAALLPLLLVPALLSRAMPFPQAIHASLLRPFLDCLDPAIAGLDFFRRISGMDRPLFHLAQMAAGAILVAIPFALATLLASPPSPRRLPPSVRLALLALLCLAVFPLVRLSFWQLNAALPLAPLLLLFSATFQVLSNRPRPSQAPSPRGLPATGRVGVTPLSSLPDPLSEGAPGRRPGGGDSTLVPPRPPLRGGSRPQARWGSPLQAPCHSLAAAFAAFAFVLSFKIFLNASISFYGFVLALPAFCCAILLLADRKLPLASARVPSGPLPEGAPGRRPGGGDTAKPLSPHLAVFFAFLLAFSAQALLLQRTVLRNGRFVPVSAPDAPAAYRTQSNVAAYLDQTLRWISQNFPPDATFAILPEGAVLNVLSGHPNSTPYVSLPSTDCLRFDEADILRAYRTSPPDFLLLVKKEVLVSDEPRFGIDYAQPLMAFLDTNYTPVLTLPVQTPAGIQPFFLLARHTPPS